MRMCRRICGVLAGALMFSALGVRSDAQALGPYLVSHSVTATTWIANGPKGYVRAYGRFDPSQTHPDLPQCVTPAALARLAELGLLGAPGDTPARRFTPEAGQLIPACIQAFNRRWGSAAGDGRNSAPWKRAGDAVGERGCTGASHCEPLLKWWNMVPELASQGPPTDLDLWDSIFTDAWDTLIEPGGMGIVPVPSPDPCAQYFTEFAAWLAQAPIPQPPGQGDTCSAFDAAFQAWLAKMPLPPASCSGTLP
jgi:hypothetical protein